MLKQKKNANAVIVNLHKVEGGDDVLLLENLKKLIVVDVWAVVEGVGDNTGHLALGDSSSLIGRHLGVGHGGEEQG